MIFLKHYFLTNSGKPSWKDKNGQPGFDMWIEIKQNIRKYENHENKITKLEFQNCHLRIDEKLFYDEKLSHLPNVEELIFDGTGEITFESKGLHTVGRTTIIFRNEKNFRTVFGTSLFNSNVAKVVLENLHFHDFSSEIFHTLGEKSSIEIRNCNIYRKAGIQTSKEVKVRNFVLDNVTLEQSNNVNPFLRLTDVQEATFSNLNWNFKHIFKNRGIIFKNTFKVLFENCTLEGFRAISAEKPGVQNVIFKR
jgi:hypothetical protein